MEAEDSTCDPDLAQDAAGAFMVVDFAAKRTPVLLLTSALWGERVPVRTLSHIR